MAAHTPAKIDASKVDVAAPVSISEKDLQNGTANFIHVDPKAQNAYVRKLDLYLLPLLSLMYLFNSVDRVCLPEKYVKSTIGMQLLMDVSFRAISPMQRLYVLKDHCSSVANADVR